MADKRTYSLTQEPDIDFDAFIPNDKSGNTEALSYKTSTLLRKKVVNELDESGNSSGTVSFSDYNLINLTINQDYDATIAGIGAHEVVILRVDKGSTDIFSVVNPTSDVIRPESVQKGLTVLFYAIYNITSADAGDTITLVKPLINQLEDNAITITADDGTVTATGLAKSVVNNNVCHFEFSFTYESDLGGTVHEFTLSNWNVTKAYASTTACYSHVIQSGSAVISNAKTSASDLRIDLSSSISTSAATYILVSGSFKVE